MPAYSTITVDEVTFEQDTDPIDLDSPYGEFIVPDFAREVDLAEPAFVVGIHAVNPAIGSEEGAMDLESLIGYKILGPGTHTDVEVAIFPTPFTNLEAGQVFPPAPDSEAEIVGAVWENFGVESPVVSSGIARIREGLDNSEETELGRALDDAEPEDCPEAIKVLAKEVTETERVYVIGEPTAQCITILDFSKDRCDEVGVGPIWGPYCIHTICCAE